MTWMVLLLWSTLKYHTTILVPIEFCFNIHRSCRSLSSLFHALCLHWLWMKCVDKNVNFESSQYNGEKIVPKPLVFFACWFGLYLLFKLSNLLKRLRWTCLLSTPSAANSPLPLLSYSSRHSNPKRKISFWKQTMLLQIFLSTSSRLRCFKPSMHAWKPHFPFATTDLIAPTLRKCGAHTHRFLQGS